MFDLILREWDLDLLDKKHRFMRKTFKPMMVESQPAQRSLFESPVTLKSDELKVVIRRKGPRLVAIIEISADVEIA